jgi:hypothetical protein
LKLILKTILIFSCFNHGLILAQTWLGYSYMLTNVHTIPQYPMPGENVKVAYTITSSSGSVNVNHQLTQVGDHFQIENCLLVGATSIVETHLDTVDCGLLLEGVYTLQIKIRGDYSGPLECDIFHDSVWLDTSFLVLPGNSIFEATESTVLLYPNPVKENLFFQTQYDEGIEYRITDLSGKLISGGELVNIQEDQSQISVVHLPAGLYLIAFFINGEWVYKRFYKT